MSKSHRPAFNFLSSGKLFFVSFPALPYIMKWLGISLLIGAAVGSASALFLISLETVTDFREANRWIIWFLPIGGLLIGLLYHYFGQRVQAGNNLLIDAIHDPQQTIPFRMAPFVYLGTITTHLLGGSAGREGTALQMAGAIADRFSKPLRLSSQDRSVLIISAVAAGFASVFGTPLAGAVFALEVFLIGRISYRSIFPAFTSAILATWFAHLWPVSHARYLMGVIPELDLKSFLFASLAGILFGLCAATFSKMMHYMSGIFRNRIAYPPLRPLIGGLVVTAAVMLSGTTRYIGLGIPIIQESFLIQLPPQDFMLKIAFTVITLSAGFKGGEVTPLFFIGAVLGSTLSLLIPLPVGLLAGMGFVAVFAGATNTPLACMLMGIELFGAGCGVFVAIACVVSYLFSGHNSIYMQQRVGEPKHSRFAGYTENTLSKL